MSLPVYFKLPQDIKDAVDIWLSENGILESIAYEWITGILAFENDYNAVAFIIKFNIYPVETTLGRMIKNEQESFN